MNRNLPFNFSFSNPFKRMFSLILVFSLFTVFSFAGNGKSNGHVVVEISGVNPTCQDGSDGSATATATGGWGPYTFNWSTGHSDHNVTSSSIYGLPAGTYEVTVVDMDLGTDHTSIVLVEAPGLDLEVTASTDCAEAGSATAEVSGGVPPYTYLWNNGQTTATATGLETGTHCVTVTDAAGCTTHGCTSVFTALSVDLDIMQSSCNTNMLTAEVTGGDPPLTYLWSNGMTSPSLMNVPAGTYTVTVTDENGCTATATGVIDESSTMDIDLSYENPNCEDDASGSATVLVTGGEPPYSYEWSTGSHATALTGLSPGDYSVTVSDNGGCASTASFTLTAGNTMNIGGDVTDAQCTTANGAISLDIDGTAPPFSAAWSNGDTGMNLTGLEAGDYTVTVTDAAGCSKEETFTVLSLAGNMDITGGVSAATCTAADGTIALSVTGDAPFTAQWSNGDTGLNVSNLTAGDYTVTVTDANGCTGTADFEVGSVTDEINITGDVSNANCGQPNGSIILDISGDAPPFTAAWSNGDTGMGITGLSEGSYSVTVTDANGCTAEDSFEVTAAGSNVSCEASIVSPITTVDGADGVATVVAAGGNPPYTYLWSNGATTQTINGLAAGSYTVTVTDADGCTATSLAVLFLNPAALGDFVWSDLNHNGIQDAGEPGVQGVVVTLTGTDINGNAVTLTDVTDGSGHYYFDGLMPGDYKITVGLPAGGDFEFTFANSGTDDAVDSDVNTTTGMSAYVTLGEGEVNTTLDAGLYSACDNVTFAGRIGYDQEVCGPGVEADRLVALMDPEGGSGDLEYLWMWSDEYPEFDMHTWHMAGADGHEPYYDPGKIYKTTYFIRCVRRENCSIFKESNKITITVGDDAVAEIDGPATVCVDQAATFSAPYQGPTALYSWEFGNYATPQTANTPSVDVSWSQPGVEHVLLSVTNNGCTSTADFGVFVSGCFNGLVITIDEETNVSNEVLIDWAVPNMDEEFDWSFVVEQSLDGVNFQEIERMPQENTTQGWKDYTYKVEKPVLGHSFYRISLVNEFEVYAVSNVAHVKRFNEGVELMIYPNPVSGTLNIEFAEAMRSNSGIEVFDAIGKSIFKDVIAKDAYRYQKDLSNLASGQYFIKMDAFGNKVFRLLKN